MPVGWMVVTSLTTVLAALGALGYNGLSLNTTRAQVAALQAYIYSIEQGQLTDRYSRAIEQIGQQGDDHLQIRLGGIYSLERLARDSPRDQPTILEVLSAFIRSNTKNCRDQPSPDVQAALTVVGRRDTTHDNGTRIDLRGACLRNAQLSDMNLAYANLANANLENARFEHTILHDANLSSVNMSHSVLTDGTDLSNAKLEKANISDANLSEANLSVANLRDAEAQRTVLADAILDKADLRSSNLEEADLRNAKLRGTDLRNAKHNEKTHVEGVVTDLDTKWW